MIYFLENEYVPLIIVGVIIFLIVFSCILLLEISRRVYLNTLTRRNKKHYWGRNCSDPNNAEQLQMWNEGCEWAKTQSIYIKDISIKSNDGLKLVGQYFDYGYKKTAIFLCGRCECLMYGYYYASIYAKNKYNLLFIDQRAHGLSEGYYSTLGIKESDDLLNWVAYLKENFKQNKFLLHCICIGCVCGTLAYIKSESKNDFEKIVLDSSFENFEEVYLRHYLDLGHKKNVIYYMIWSWFKRYTKCDFNEASLIQHINEIDIPMLFIVGKQDKYSLPEKTLKMYDLCQNPNKKLEMIENGTHSHNRIVNPEKYDNIIQNFIK